MLLGLKAIDVDGKFGRHDGLGQINEPPTFHLRPVAEVEVFSQCVVVPAPRIRYARFAPDTGGAIEVKKSSAATSSGLFEKEVPIEEERLHFGEQRIVAVQVAPAHLHHPDTRVGKVINGPSQCARRRHEISVKNEDELTGGLLQTRGEGSGLETCSVNPMMIIDVQAFGLKPCDFAGGDLLSLVGGIIENLDLQFVARIVELADCSDQSSNDVVLVINRQLDSDS